MSSRLHCTRAYWTAPAAQRIDLHAFADFQRTTPKPNEVWRANFYRVNRAAEPPRKLLSWSPTRLPGFHQPGRFGYLEFGP